MSEPLLRVISLGAGVQSTTMALMAAHGELGPMPHCAVFADTQDEPQEVYDHLKWLSGVLPFPVYTVTKGRVSDAMLAGDDEARSPLFIKDGSISFRQCTRNYKIKPLRRKYRELLAAGPRGRIQANAVEQWIGISTDEAVRIKPSGLQYIKNRHPLIEAGMDREACKGWLWDRYQRRAPKSACGHCGFGYKRLESIKQHDPSLWSHLVRFDAALRSSENIARFRGELYVHPARVPLEEAVVVAANPAQRSLFGNECEGMCGV